MHCTTHYNNSAGNLANPDPSKAVRWGPQAWHEMMIGWYDIAIPIAQAEKTAKQNENGQQETKN